MTMPDREKTRPWLLESVTQAELDLEASRLAARALGPTAGERGLNRSTAALAAAGTLLALADAEWAREDAAAAKTNVKVTVVPKADAPNTPNVPPGPVEIHSGKPIY